MRLALWAIRIPVKATSLTLSSYRPQLAGSPSLYLSSPLYHPIPPPPDPSSLKSLLLHHGETYCSQGKVPIPLHGSIFTHCRAPRRLFTVHPEWRRRSDKENSCNTLQQWTVKFLTNREPTNRVTIILVCVLSLFLYGLQLLQNPDLATHVALLPDLPTDHVLINFLQLGKPNGIRCNLSEIGVGYCMCEEVSEIGKFGC